MVTFTDVEVIVTDNMTNVSLFVNHVSKGKKKMQIYFANNLRWLLGFRQITYREAAKRMGLLLNKKVDFQKVGRLVAGKGKGPDLDTLAALSIVLECPTDAMIFADLENEAEIVLPNAINGKQIKTLTNDRTTSPNPDSAPTKAIGRPAKDA